jgi:hypothetical protein
MPNPPNSSAGGDIGIPSATPQGAVSASGEGDSASQQTQEGATVGARDVQPDAARPVIDAVETPAAEPQLSDKERAQNGKAGQKQILTSETAKTSAPEATKTDQKEITPPKTAAASWPSIDCSKPHEKMEEAITECMKTKYGTTLVTDAEDAQILLSYVTRNGLQEDKKIDDETILTLIATRERLRTGVFDSQTEEAKFRKHYGIIAKAAAPVTVVSLRDSLTTERRRRWFTLFLLQEQKARPIAEIACLRYRNYAFLTLVALLIFQIYWTISSAILNKTDALISEINKAPTEAVYLAQEAVRQDAIKAANQQKTAETTSPKPIPAQTNPAPTGPTDARTDKTQLTLDELVSRLAELDANYVMLNGLMKPMALIFFRQTLPAFELIPTADTEKSQQQKDEPAKNAKAIFIPSPFQTQSATIRTVAGQVIDVMQKWLLPLLYGALGAMVFVVRTLSLQARDRLFRREGIVFLILRVFLGAISGLAIGWFWNQTPQTPTTAGPMSLATLSPFALAFIAGYGVELFFTLLDKIISTFTNKA